MQSGHRHHHPFTHVTCSLRDMAESCSFGVKQ